MTRSRKPRYAAGAQNKHFGAGLQTDFTANRRLKRALFKSDGKNPASSHTLGMVGFISNLNKNPFRSEIRKKEISAHDRITEAKV